jgi:hypothetical protein
MFRDYLRWPVSIVLWAGSMNAAGGSALAAASQSAFGSQHVQGVSGPSKTTSDIDVEKFAAHYKKWMDRWIKALRSRLSTLEKTQLEDIRGYRHLVEKRKRVQEAQGKRILVHAEEWLASDEASLSELRGRLGQPPIPRNSHGQPIMSQAAWDEKVLGDLNKRRWPGTERVREISQVQRWIKRKAVRPWMVALSEGEMGVVETDLKLIGSVDGDPVVEIDWKPRRVLDGAVEPKGSVKSVFLRLRGIPLPVQNGATARLRADMYIGALRVLEIGGKKVSAYEVFPVDYQACLQKAGEAVKAGEIAQPL